MICPRPQARHICECQREGDLLRDANCCSCLTRGHRYLTGGGQCQMVCLKLHFLDDGRDAWWVNDKTARHPNHLTVLELEMNTAKHLFIFFAHCLSHVPSKFSGRERKRKRKGINTIVLCTSFNRVVRRMSKPRYARAYYELQQKVDGQTNRNGKGRGKRQAITPSQLEGKKRGASRST